MTFSLMGQEGTKGDFEACGVCVCVSVRACVYGRKIQSSLNASKRVFDLGLYLCFRCVLTSPVSKERLFYSVLLLSFMLIKLHV